MTPEYDALIAKINKAGNVANTHGGTRKLVTEYGEALHNFIEEDPLVKGGLKALKMKQTDYDKVKGPPGGITSLLALGKQMGFNGNVTAGSLTALAATCGAHARVGASSAAAVVGGGDEASEDFVDAAMWYFRQALCIYAANDLTNAKLPSAGGPVATFDAKLAYANALYGAGDMLMKAVAQEDATDFAEIIAEYTVAKQLFEEADVVYSELQNEMDVKKKVTMAAADRTAFDAKQTASNNGATGATNKLAAIGLR